MGYSEMTQQLPEGFELENGGAPAGPAMDVPPGFVVDQGARRREDTPEALRNNKGIFQSFSEWVTGEGRNTQSIEQLPSLIDNGFLEGAKLTDVAKVAAMTMLTNDPNELAQIIKKQVPGISIQYNKDAEGNIYPILVNQNNGQTAIVDKPGADLMNLGQFIGQSALFATGGGAGTVARTAALEGGKELGLQSLQGAAGGSVDAGDVVAAATIGGAFQGAGNIVEKGFMAMRGVPTQETVGILSAANEFNVPVLTSDIYNPKNWFSRSVQFGSEALPVVGTGGIRMAQQDARERALQDFVSLYRGGSYEDVIQSIATKSQEAKDAAGAVYNRVNPYLDQLSQDGGVPLTRAQVKLDEVTDQLLRPGLVVSDGTLDFLDDFDAAFRGGDQSFQVLKSNISAWREKIDSIDTAERSQMPSHVKTKLRQVLAAATEDRDTFARQNLIPEDFEKLKAADMLWGQTANELRKTKIKGLMDKGDVTPEIARQMLFSNKPSELRLLYRSLTPEGRSSARSTFISEVVSNLDKQQRGLSPTSFVGQMKRYSDTIDVMFEGQRKEELEGLMNLLDITSRAQEVTRGAGSQTAERVMAGGATLAAGGGYIPWEMVGAYASIGGMARLFESPRVRSIMMRAKGVDPRSDAARDLAEQFGTILRSSAQANPAKGQSEVEQEISDTLTPDQQQQPAEEAQ